MPSANPYPAPLPPPSLGSPPHVRARNLYAELRAEGLERAEIAALADALREIAQSVRDD